MAYRPYTTFEHQTRVNTYQTSYSRPLTSSVNWSAAKDNIENQSSNAKSYLKPNLNYRPASFIHTVPVSSADKYEHLKASVASRKVETLPSSFISSQPQTVQISERKPVVSSSSYKPSFATPQTTAQPATVESKAKPSFTQQLKRNYSVETLGTSYAPVSSAQTTKLLNERRENAAVAPKPEAPHYQHSGLMLASDSKPTAHHSLLRSHGHRAPSIPQSLSKTEDQSSNSSASKSINYQITCSLEKSKGVVQAFGICTTQGIVKSFNEDGVSIIMNVTRDLRSLKTDPKAAEANFSYFSVFDGHGGNKCVNYLRDNLHLKILNDPDFPTRCDRAIFNGVLKAEKEFLDMAQSTAGVDRSGACCIIALFKDSECYLGNVGDCRAVLSLNQGSRDLQLTVDHKPESLEESERVKRAGGYVYKKTIKTSEGISVGPSRIVPGKLSVARTVGDIKAKYPIYGGNPNVIIPDPDIFVTTIDQASDFIVMCSRLASTGDGIFDKLSSRQVVDIIWSAFRRNKGQGLNIHQLCKKAVEAVVVAAMESKSSDNLTCLILGLPGLHHYLASTSSKLY